MCARFVIVGVCVYSLCVCEYTHCVLVYILSVCVCVLFVYVCSLYVCVCVCSCFKLINQSLGNFCKHCGCFASGQSALPSAFRAVYERVALHVCACECMCVCVFCWCVCGHSPFDTSPGHGKFLRQVKSLREFVTYTIVFHKIFHWREKLKFSCNLNAISLSDNVNKFRSLRL